MKRIVVAFAMAALAGCGGGNQPSPTAPTQDDRQSFTTDHFRFSYLPLDGNLFPAAAEALEREHGRVLGDLGVAGMPRVNIVFYDDFDTMARTVAPTAGPLPSMALGVVTSPTDIHLMSPNAPHYSSTRDALGSNLVHEFTHCVSMFVNRSIPNNPRWLWEAVAVYESGQFVDPRILPYMVAGNPPTLSSMSAFDNSYAYDVGYVLAEFIVERGGQAALRGLIQNNGNTHATLGLDTASFEREWYAFVRARYLIR